MPSYYETSADDISANLADIICKRLAAHHAIAMPRNQRDANPQAAVARLVSPTINMIHSAHQSCIDGVGRYDLLPHLRQAYQRVLGSRMTPEDDHDFVNDIAQIALESTVRNVVLQSEQASFDRRSPTNVLAAYAISNSVSSAMRRERVSIVIDSVADGRTKAYYISPTGRAVRKDMMRRVTYEEYSRFIDNPLLEVELKGIAGEDYEDEELRGCVLYRTKGGIVVMRDSEGLLDDVDPKVIKVLWSDLDIETSMSQAERAEIRSFLIDSLAEIRVVPTGAGRQTISGVASRVTPLVITVDDQDYRFDQLVEGPHSTGDAVAFLPVTEEITRVILDEVARALLPAFSDSAFSRETAERIIAASEQK